MALDPYTILYQWMAVGDKFIFILLFSTTTPGFSHHQISYVEEAIVPWK